MDIGKWLSALPQFLILLPAAASCYFAAKNKMKYSPLKTAALCILVLLPYSLLTSWICVLWQLDINIILIPSICLFFFLYRKTVTVSLPGCLAIYVGVCAIQTFPAQFAYAFDSYLHPDSSAACFSTEAALFQLLLSCLVVAAFAYPACQYFSWAIDNLDFPKIWYSTVVMSLVFLIFNILSVPQSYATLHTGRLYYLFPLLEACSLVLLTAIYVFFFQGARLILRHAELKERSQLLEMQVRQYNTLQEYMCQTTRLRHDFKHSVHILAVLAEKGDIDSINAHLKEYETRLDRHAHINYCSNAALDALFNYYHEMAVSAKVDARWNIELPEPITEQVLDMASLFGNLMENAIAGCLGIPEEARYFCLTTEVRHGNRLYIVSTNSFDGHVRKTNDEYHSTKHSGKGTGLASITAVAIKYNGSVRISNSNKEFFVDVMLKI